MNVYLSVSHLAQSTFVHALHLSKHVQTVIVLLTNLGFDLMHRYVFQLIYKLSQMIISDNKVNKFTRKATNFIRKKGTKFFFLFKIIFY